MAVAEIFVTALVQVVFDRLASRELFEFATRQGIDRRLKKLEANLKMITKVITHAENMPIRETGVDEWLEELRDWAYDADDFLDEVNTRAMQQHQQQAKEEEEEARRSSSSSLITKVRGFVNRCDIVVGFNSRMHSNVDELDRRLETISQRMEEMRRLMKMTLTTDNTTSTMPLPISQRPSKEAPADEFDTRVFGREQDKEKIIEQLKSSRGANVEVIPIVGMPGIGKTTLARHVLNSVKQQLFDIKGWVSVSDDFDVTRITRDILKSFNFRTSDSSGLNQLQSELKEVVGGKRFLLVLDDVWSRNYVDDWGPLRAPFRVGAPGSKILVTTRDEEVASMMQTDDPMKIHRLRPLRDDDCWPIFLKHVIDNINPAFESEAGRFRKKILDKCKGLPLTAKLLAGILRGESPGQGWEAKLNSSIWDVSKNELSGKKGDRMLPVVMLSYFHLPSQLKPCFSYCAVFPEDYEFGEEEVVSMWMAQCLVSPENGEQVEVTGAKYFRELVSRSLFQRSPNDSSRFLMHDLIHDMAEIVAGKSCFKLDRNRKIDSIPQQARYSTYRLLSGLKMEFETFERTKYLRVFQLIGAEDWIFNLTSYVTLELLMKMKYLRLICLSRYSIRELPEDIGDLIHLRHVDLSYTSIKSLPESTSSLFNLQTLELKGCNKLRTLPTQMRKLTNLRNLDCSGRNKLVAMPVGMGKLTSLRKLSNFIVGNGLEQDIGQLKYLSHLKGRISISFLENVLNSKEAREAKLMSKKGLCSLELEWNLPGTDASLHVFEELQPHEHLEELIISGYSGPSFPGWVGDDKFSKMRVIKLANCVKCTSLPPLGKLPVLEEIQIGCMAGIECVGEEFYGKEREAFLSLKILKFEDMENWSTWSYPAGGGCRFDCLQELHVINCPKLTRQLPDGISLRKLTIRKCDELLVALPSHSILEMDIQECKVELMECLKEDGDAIELLPSVTTLSIEDVDVVEAIGSAGIKTKISSNKDVAEAHHRMMMLSSLTVLRLASIPKLTHLPGLVLQGLPKLNTLTIRRCEDLTSLWKMDDGDMAIGGFLNSLCLLRVEECCQLVCLVPQQCPGLPCGLGTLYIEKCEKLEKLPSDLHNLTSLRELHIRDCRRLSSLPDMGFPSTLENLKIEGCELLTSLSSSASASASSSVAMGGNGMPLPHSLKRLTLIGCKNLESWVGGGTAFTSADYSFPSLESVQIGGCPKLKSLREGITHRRLKWLSIVDCENLGELPISFHHLTDLEFLRINGWPAGLLSIQQGGPNPDSLPPNISGLSIRGDAGPNPLPSSLTFLAILHFKKLSPEAFQNLTSLQSLFIFHCPELTSIPDQWLPPSLQTLYIGDCPLLAPEFAKGKKGRYWPKVKFIPDVQIDGRSIFDDPEEEDEVE